MQFKKALSEGDFRVGQVVVIPEYNSFNHKMKTILHTFHYISIKFRERFLKRNSLYKPIFALFKVSFSPVYCDYKAIRCTS